MFKQQPLASGIGLAFGNVKEEQAAGNFEYFLLVGSLNFKFITASIMPKNRSVDIDDIDDFNYAEYLLNDFNK